MMNKNKNKRVIVIRGNDGHIDPETNVVPKFSDYMITDNKTDKNGRVINRSDIDAEMAKKETDMNHK